jgi:Na+/H+ antiporter NhaD/arsenite permease-like protein
VLFLAFVVALGVVVRAVSAGGLGRLVDRLVPGGSGLTTLLAVAALAAVLANLVNNLPAILLVVPARDGDRSRLGPHSLGPATRFVVDHAPCAVLLTWPARAPDVASIPPPPAHPPPPPGVP